MERNPPKELPSEGQDGKSDYTMLLSPSQLLSFPLSVYVVILSSIPVSTFFLFYGSQVLQLTIFFQSFNILFRQSLSSVGLGLIFLFHSPFLVLATK